jgi:hypothetical protein
MESFKSNRLHKAAAASYFLWGVMHLWVMGAVIAQRYAEGPMGALRALGSPAADLGADAILRHASNVAVDFAINLGAAGLLAAWLAVLVWRGSRLALWLNAVILGLVDLSFVICLLGPGYIPMMAGIWGPVLYVAGVLLGALGSRASVGQDGAVAAPAAR